MSAVLAEAAQVSSAPSSPARPKPAPISPQKRDELALQANAKAKEMFLHKYEGATIELPTVLHNRPVVRMFKRSFNIAMRNWHIATTVPRSALGESTLATLVETGMLKKVSETVKYFKTECQKLEVIGNDASINFALISHGYEFKDDTKVIGPVAMQLRELFLTVDRFIDLNALIYSFGQITGEQASNNTYEVKRKVEGVITSIRNFRIMALNRVNEQGKSREGFKAVKIDGEDAGQPDGGGASAPASVVASDPAVPSVAAADDAPPAAAATVVQETEVAPDSVPKATRARRASVGTAAE